MDLFKSDSKQAISSKTRDAFDMYCVFRGNPDRISKWRSSPGRKPSFTSSSVCAAWASADAILNCASFVSSYKRLHSSSNQKNCRRN